tara:strand:+ start:431 stop:1168 length:738 start_codon:yes stop_codon:yes gene_type:complete
MRLEGKKIIVTAAGQGIGRATALAFSKEGAKVIAIDINESSLLSLKKEDNSIEIKKLDATNQNEINIFSNKIDNIDSLFHAVGFVHHGSILKCSLKDYEDSMKTNVFSAYLMILSFLPKMLNKKKGSIIIVSSAASSIKGAQNRFIYGTTKGALNGMIKSIAADFVKDGIRCNAILPGTVLTPSWEERVAKSKNPEKAKQDFISRQAMGRLGRPEEIASFAVYLASDESEFVTGGLHVLDGGWTL